MRSARELLGTRIVVETEAPLFMVEAAYAEAERCERAFSRFVPESEVSLLNGRVGEWVKVSAELYDMLAMGVALEEKTGGAFSVTVHDVLTAWGYDAGYSLREQGGARTGEVLLRSGEVCVTAPVDIGAVGKGYVLTRMAGMFPEGVPALINAGGDVWSNGGQKVYLEHPEKEGVAVGEVVLRGEYLAGSGARCRRWGKYHHLVDARNMAPAQDMLGTFVLDDDGMRADGWSTALFVSGFAEARRLAEQEGIAAVLLGAKGEVWVSERFTGRLYGEEEQGKKNEVGTGEKGWE